MNAIYHQANSRGRADHGWLLSRHTFSFADYYDPERLNFGLLRVLNDDVVAPGMGFGTHPHADMEIISIPLAGAIRHEDSMGHAAVLHTGEVQVMTAGSGISHSEYNASATEDLRFLQIWIYPDSKGLLPRYAQQRFDPAERQDRFQLLVAPEGAKEGLTIHQQVWLSRAELHAGSSLVYHRHDLDSGVYLFVIEGEVTANHRRLSRRDGLGLTEHGAVDLQAEEKSDLLVIEVPLNTNAMH